VRVRSPLYPICESLTQEDTGTAATEEPIDTDVPLSEPPPPLQPAIAGCAGDVVPTSQATAATVPGAGWTAWTMEDACSPASQAEDDWADWGPSPRDAKSTQEVPPRTREETEPTLFMEPATRALSTAAPERPTVWPRFASIEAWISRLPDPEVAGVPRGSFADVGSAPVPVVWHMRPSVGTWLAARRAHREWGQRESEEARHARECSPASVSVSRDSADVQRRGPADGPCSGAGGERRTGGACQQPADELALPELPDSDDGAVAPGTSGDGRAMEVPACAPTAAAATAAVSEAAPPQPAADPAPRPGLREPRPWHTRPSVGTWLLTSPLGREGAVDSDAPESSRQAAAAGAPLGHRPCGEPWGPLVSEATALASTGAKAATLSSDRSDELFHAAAAVLPKAQPADAKPAFVEAVNSVLSFDPYAPEDEEEPSAGETVPSDKADECPVS